MYPVIFPLHCIVLVLTILPLHYIIQVPATTSSVYNSILNRLLGKSMQTLLAHAWRPANHGLETQLIFYRSIILSPALTFISWIFLPTKLKTIPLITHPPPPKFMVIVRHDECQDRFTFKTAYPGLLTYCVIFMLYVTQKSLDFQDRKQSFAVFCFQCMLMSVMKTTKTSLTASSYVG